MIEEDVKESVYAKMEDICNNLLKHIQNTSSKEEFFNGIDEKTFEKMQDMSSFCFYKVNELSIQYCESIKRGEVPKTDQRDLLFAFPIASLAHLLGIWDGTSKDSPFYYYCEFGKGKFSEIGSREILKNQKAIEKFANALFYVWCQVNSRGVFMKFKKMA